MNMVLTVSDKNVANELQFLSIMMFVRIFAGVYCNGGDEPEWNR